MCVGVLHNKKTSRKKPAKNKDKLKKLVVCTKLHVFIIKIHPS